MNKQTIALIAAVVFLLLVVILAKKPLSRPRRRLLLRQLSKAKKIRRLVWPLRKTLSLRFRMRTKLRFPITVVAQLTDVPAGTGVDVFLSSYDSKTANGSSIYTGNYGKYNFYG